MNKKEYMTPQMRVVRMKHQSHILAGSSKSVPMHDEGQITDETQVW